MPIIVGAIHSFFINNSRNMKRHFKHSLFILALIISAMATLTSCGDDEPNSKVIDYYLDVEEEFLVDGSTSRVDRYYNPVTRMREAIRKAYPKPDGNGNDDAVIAACDKEYETYVSFYEGGSEHFTCLFHLVRATKEGSIVKKSETLKTYTYDINPPVPEPEGD